MIKKITLSILTISTLIIISNSLQTVNSNQTGAIAGMTGSPGDAMSCTNCHGGTATPQTGWITSTVPSTGYIPGTDYVITATMTVIPLDKFGFEISPQNTAGDLMGTMTVLNSTETQLISSNKYITHTFSGTAATNNSKTWQFTWTAPAQGSGDVTFYGAFVASNSDATFNGDDVHTSSLTVSEDATSSISDKLSSATKIAVYPNLIQSTFTVSYTNESAGKVTIDLLDITGKRINRFIDGDRSIGIQNEKLQLLTPVTSGVYFIKISSANSSSMQKVVIM